MSQKETAQNLQLNKFETTTSGSWDDPEVAEPQQNLTENEPAFEKPEPVAKESTVDEPEVADNESQGMKPFPDDGEGEFKMVERKKRPMRKEASEPNPKDDSDGKPRSQTRKNTPKGKQFEGKPRGKQFEGKPRGKQFEGKPKGKQFEGKPRGNQTNGNQTNGNQRTSQNSGQKKSYKREMFCNFCANQDLPEEECKGHLPKTCPRLKEYECPRCGEKGHTRSRCETEFCVYCKDFGHKVAECPEILEHKCKKCKGIGHRERQCPTFCAYCKGAVGHVVENCPNKRCNFCGGDGHLMGPDCPMKQFSYRYKDH